jgi:hypothetical protein
MPNIHFNCPNCKQHISAPDAIIGTQAECPICNAQFNVSPLRSELEWEYEKEKPQEPAATGFATPFLHRINPDAITKQADGAFSTAKICFWLGIVLSIFAVLIVGSSEDRGAWLGCCGVASLLFLFGTVKVFTGHLLHIRAAIIRLGSH